MKGLLTLVFLLSYQVGQANSYNYSQRKNIPPVQPATPNVDSLSQSISSQQNTNSNHADFAGGVKKQSALTKVIGYGAAAGLSYLSYTYFSQCTWSKFHFCALGASAAAGAYYSLKQTRNVQVSEAKACVSGLAVSTVGGGCGSLPITSTSTPQEIEKAVDEEHESNQTNRDVKKRIQEAANKAGFKLEPDTGNLTFPDGKKLNLNSATPAQMQAAGLDMGKLKTMINDAYTEAAEKVAGSGIDGTEGLLSEAGGGGVGSIDGVTEYSDDQLTAGNSAIGKAQALREPAAAGKTKLKNGELIGVAGDNLFMMMTRRYAHLNKHQGHTFFQDKP